MGFALVELFTSEGCSSCPPADELLARLDKAAKADGHAVYALAFHVDYWDQLGWRDRFASPDFSHRQSEYANARHADDIYTPQMIVNGAAGFVGSDAKRASDEIAKALKEKPAVVVDLKVASGDGASKFVVNYAVSPSVAKGSVVNVALVQRQATSDVPRGENAGRTLRHVNIVRSIKHGTVAADGSGRVEVSLPDGVRAEQAQVVAFVQNEKTMAIFGASATELPSSDR